MTTDKKKTVSGGTDWENVTFRFSKMFTLGDVSGGGSSSQIEAVNNTGSAITSGDKVWINREDGENKLVAFDNDVYNIASSDMHNVASLSRYFTPVTNNAKYLSISSSSISNFISSLFTSSSNDFELVVKFFVNSASEHSRIFNLQVAATPGSSFFTWCSLSEDSSSLKKISLGFSYAYNAWDGINLDTEIEDNTWYYLIYNRSSGKLSLSLAKNSLNNVIETVTNSRDNVVFYCSSSYTYIALAQTNSDYIPLTYDLSETSFNSSYQNINWKALDLGNITSDTQTGIAAENIAIDTTGLVNVGAVIEPTGSITITENGTHDVSDYAEAVVNVASGVDVITAVNNTGSAITSGDKVWINQDGNTYELVNYYSSVPNFDIVGSPTITNGVVSGFSSSNYLQLPQKFNPGNNAWEINLKIYLTDVSTWQFIYNGNVSYYGVAIEVSPSGVFQIELSGSTSSFSIGNIIGTTPLVINTNYWLKLIFTGSEYKLKLSTDGINFIDDGNSIITSTPITPSIGVFGLQYILQNPFLGSIDLKETYIKINSVDWWTPYVTNITVDTQTGTAAENIVAGGTGLVNVASGV